MTLSGQVLLWAGVVLLWIVAAVVIRRHRRRGGAAASGGRATRTVEDGEPPDGVRP